jgi:hypothetical protein
MDWIPNIFRRRRLYQDLSEEISLHIEERVAQLMREGMSRREAEEHASRAFGWLSVRGRVCCSSSGQQGAGFHGV